MVETRSQTRRAGTSPTPSPAPSPIKREDLPPAKPRSQRGVREAPPPLHSTSLAWVVYILALIALLFALFLAQGELASLGKSLWPTFGKSWDVDTHIDALAHDLGVPRSELARAVHKIARKSGNPGAADAVGLGDQDSVVTEMVGRVVGLDDMPGES